MTKKIIDGKEYAWVNYQYILDELPLLNVGKRSLMDRFKKLINLKILSHITCKENGTFSYYGYGENYSLLISDYEQEGMKNSSYPMKNSSYPYEENFTPPMKNSSHQNNSSIIYNSSIKDKTTTKTAEPNGDKSISENKKGFEKIVSDYTQNEKLKETIFDFVKMRKAQKKPMTDRALQLLLNRLDKLFANDDDKIISLEKSIINCWKSVYELKPEEMAQAKQQQDEMEQYWGQFNV